MVLETDESFAVGSATVIQQFKSQRPFFLAELAGLEHFCPLGSPQMVLNHIFVVLSVNNGSLIHHNFCCVPFTKRFLVLWNCRNHIVERSGLPVIVLTQFGIGMVGIIQHLVFGRGNIDRFGFYVAVFIGCSYFLCQIEDTRVTSFGDFPLQHQFKVFELVVENNIATVTVLGFTASRTVELDSTVFDGPFSGYSILAVSAPAGKVLTVEQYDVTVFIRFKLRQVHLRFVNY